MKIRIRFVGLLALLLAIFFIACSDDSGSGTSAGFTSEEDDPSSYIAEKIVPIKNKTISGYAQKGPFKAGSVVDIYELELDGKTFAQTGKSFTGKVANNKGEFKIPNVSLKSQYALLKVTGYFTSEINGDGVRATLTAVTDLSKRESVNVNILTHLEYDRVLALLGKGMNFTSAKKQAGREVLAAFGIGLEENVAAEDLDVSGENDADAALVAISKLVLAGEKEGTNRDEEDLSGLLARIAGSIGENGTWDGSSSIATRISIMAGVNWGFFWDGNECRLTRHYLYEKDHVTISEWREVSFSPEMNLFYQIFISWLYTGQFCMSSVDGKIVTAPAFYKNEFDEFNLVRDASYMYLCKDGNWRFIGKTISDGDSVTQEWCDNFIEDLSRGKDGEIRKGDITGLDYKYDEKMGKWRRIDSKDTLFSTVCTLNHVGELIENIVDSVIYIDETYVDTATYVCDENGWRKIAAAEENFGATCTDKNRGLCKQFGDSVFCCDSSGWRKANYRDYAFEKNVMEICTLDKRGKIMKGLNGVSYKCVGGSGFGCGSDIFGVDTCDYFSYWKQVSIFDTLISPCVNTGERYISCMGKNVLVECVGAFWVAYGCVGISTADSLKFLDYRSSGDINNIFFGREYCDRKDVEECPIEI